MCIRVNMFFSNIIFNKVDKMYNVNFLHDYRVLHFLKLITFFQVKDERITALETENAMLYLKLAQVI